MGHVDMDRGEESNVPGGVMNMAMQGMTIRLAASSTSQ